MNNFLGRNLAIYFPGILLSGLLFFPLYFFHTGYAQPPAEQSFSRIISPGMNSRYLSIGNVKGFFQKLNENKKLKTLMQTPWGRDIFSSAPLSAFGSAQAALKLFPENFRFEAVTLFMTGSLYYSSGSAGYVLFFESNTAGKTLIQSSSLNNNRIAYANGFVVFASSTALLNTQLEALKNQVRNPEIPENILRTDTLCIFLPERPETGKKNVEQTDLVFASIETLFPNRYMGAKKAYFIPTPTGLTIEASIDYAKGKADEIWFFYQNGKADFRLASAIEKTAFGLETSQDSSNIRLFSDESRTLLPIKGEKTSTGVMFYGLMNDYGILLPNTTLVFNRLDSSIISFLSQAFKFNKYQETAVQNGVKFTFNNPYLYYSKKKAYTFEPHLITQEKYGIWSTTAPSLKVNDFNTVSDVSLYTQIESPGENEHIFAIFRADVHSLVQSTASAMKSFEGVYFPQYLGDFKEALGKMQNTLKGSQMRGISIISKSQIRAKAMLSL